MARSRFCRVCKGWHALETAWPSECVDHWGPPKLGRSPNIISDTMGPTRNMADGRLYDSKSRYYEAVKAAGCEIVGDDQGFRNQRPPEPEYTTGHDVKRAIEQLRSQ